MVSPTVSMFRSTSFTDTPLFFRRCFLFIWSSACEQNLYPVTEPEVEGPGIKLYPKQSSKAQNTSPGQAPATPPLIMISFQV